MINVSLQRYLLVGLGSVWCVLILTRVFTAEAPEEVPLTFVSGKSAAKTRAAVGALDPWQVKQVTIQAREVPAGPKKNIFAPLGESTAVGATTVVAKKMRQAAPPPPVVAVVTPVAPPEPTPEELAEQATRQQAQLVEQGQRLRGSKKNSCANKCVSRWASIATWAISASRV
jgi:hypothetical protein